MKETWRIVKEVIGIDTSEVGTCNGLKSDDSLITDQFEISNHFNNYFSSIGNNLASNIPNTNRDPLDFMRGNYPTSLFLSPVTHDELTSIIRDLANGGPGPDEILPKVINRFMNNLIQPLLHTINLSFLEGIFPAQLKTANVTPIFKSGDSKLVGNYRPISILSVFSKIIEKLMHSRLYQYLASNNVLYAKQFGFRKGVSTEVALISAVDKITRALDSKKHVVSLFLDFRKAFDTVNIPILLSKLAHYGIRGVALEWFRSFLTGRMQRVKFNGIFSDLKDVSCGVPQGSTLGPLLFLVYLNDLPCVLDDAIDTYLFADDTTLFMIGDDLNLMTGNFNTQMTQLVLWLNTNKLSLNLQKTHCMLFTLSPRIRSLPLNIFINQTPIERVHSTKFLGVHIDEQLKWKQHSEYIANKMAKSIGILNKVKRYLNSKTLLMLYYSLIYPYLNYCHLLWGKAPAVHTNKLFVLQKRAVRIISNSQYLAHSIPLYKELNIVPFDELYRFQCSIFVYKCIKELFPTHVLELINPFPSLASQDYQPVLTRSASSLVTTPFCRTAIRQTFVYYQATHLYNNFLFPLNILNLCNSTHHFKRLLKNILV